LAEVDEVRLHLDPRELDDFAMHHAATALAAKDVEMVKRSIEIIDSLETSGLYFQLKIKDDLINLLKWQVENPEKSVTDEKDGWLKAIMLQPNFAGIGVDLNHIIAKLTAKKDDEGEK